MPCISCGAFNPSSFNGGNSNDDVIVRLTEENKNLEAILCALTTEMHESLDLDVYNDLIGRASENGVVDIDDWIQTHKKADEERIKKALQSEYSAHELKLIKEMLNRDNG
jgi:predicted aldo/keto reductase-like oxidoreductase